MDQYNNYPGNYKLAIVEGNIVRVRSEDTEKLPEGSILFLQDDVIDLMALPKDFPQELMEQVRAKIYDENGKLNPNFWTYPRLFPVRGNKNETQIP